MHFKACSAAVFGIDAYLVEVEVDIGSSRLGDFNVVGLPDVAVKESRERIKGLRSRIAATIFRHRALQ
jgi:magnesium chelatase family protein